MSPTFLERARCPVCRSGRLDELYRRPYASGPVREFLFRYYGLAGRGSAEGWEERFAGAEYVLQGCADCRAVSQRFAPGPELAAELYAGWIDGEGGSAGRPFDEHVQRLREAAALTAFLLRHHRASRPDQLEVLDFGAGWGAFAHALRACGCRVTAVEPSATRADRLRQSGFPVLDADDVPTTAFHFINTEQVFEHLPDPLETAERLRAGLVDRGVLKVSVPFARSAERDPIEIDWTGGRSGKRSWVPFQPLEHLTYYRRPSLQLLARRLGLREVHVSWRDELDAGLGWTRPRIAVRNLARLLPRRWFRNSFLFAR